MKLPHVRAAPTLLPKSVFFQTVNADQDPHTVFESIESLLVKPLPKQTLKAVM